MDKSYGPQRYMNQLPYLNVHESAAIFKRSTAWTNEIYEIKNYEALNNDQTARRILFPELDYEDLNENIERVAELLSANAVLTLIASLRGYCQYFTSSWSSFINSNFELFRFYYLVAGLLTIVIVT